VVATPTARLATYVARSEVCMYVLCVNIIYRYGFSDIYYLYDIIIIYTLCIIGWDERNSFDESQSCDEESILCSIIYYIVLYTIYRWVSGTLNSSVDIFDATQKKPCIAQVVLHNIYVYFYNSI